MSSIGELVQGAQELTIGGYLFASGAVLALYDYVLMFDDEIRYVWKGRKTWIFYLYITNRFFLVVLQFWQIYYISTPSHSKIFCFWRYYIQVIAAPLCMFSSEIFITLRIYALTSKNKVLAAYFGSMTLAILVVSLASNLIKPPVVVDPGPLILIDAFELCEFIANYQFRLVPHSMATTFDLSAFLVIVLYAYRDRQAFKFSVLVRKIVGEATIYFPAMVAAQTCILLSFSFMEVISQRLLYITYGIIIPILTLRFAISLKRSADPEGGQEWQTRHFSSISFASSYSSDAQVSDVCQDIEMDHVDPLNDRVQTTDHYQIIRLR